VRGIALAASLIALPAGAFAATTVPDRRARSTAVLLRTIFPHARLADDFYLGVANSYLAEIKAKSAAVAEHDRGLALLDGSHIAPFFELPSVIRKSLVDKIDQEPFFKAIQWRGAELIYRNAEVWKMVGYEGSSVEYGGYHDRGFNDIDWLPKAVAATAAGATA
jgi:hypothetical protein